MLKKFPTHETNPFNKGTKFDDKSFITLMNLNDYSIRLLHYMAYTSSKKRYSYLPNITEDYKIEFDIEDAQIKVNKSHTAIYRALEDLIQNNIIARTERHHKYFINPKFLLHRANRRLKR
ncbi:MAG TPA: hypothetical protein VK213_14340 [Bacteroidales bacterium]|nr:hypothetical protein [Bacteroidales bacterium]